MLTIGPGYLLDFHPTARTVHPAHGVEQIDRNVPTWNESETALGGHVVVAGSGFGAPAATRFAIGSRSNPGFDERLLTVFGIVLRELHLIVNESLERVHGIE